MIENSLSDAFVDSAFQYEKVIVDYIIYNETTKQEVKRLSVDMGNKYQPKTQTIYLDSSELDDGKKYFTRGYNYKVGYVLNFFTEDGSNPVYEHDKLYKNIKIERQAPLYTQYISTSNSTGITYRYSFKDTDRALANNNFYYTIGEETTDYKSIDKSIVADNDYHEVTIPFTENTNYTLYYAKKNTTNETEYVSMTEYNFETEYDYNNQNAYTIINDNDNVLKIRLEHNNVTDRAAVYKVEITASDQKERLEYVRYFLASKLSTISLDTGEVDEEGNPILDEHKYIAIDYANISKFIGHKMKVVVHSYYDSGLVGLDQDFRNGLILKNSKTNKYLNTYNSGSNKTSTSRADSDNMGMYLLKEPHAKGDETIFLYNHLMDTINYNPLLGAAFYDSANLAPNIGINYNVSYTNAGLLLNDGKNDYSGYNARVLKEAILKTDNDLYEFNTIVPTINVVTKNNTINSIGVQITPRGIYGNKQFIKDGVAYNKIYLEFYSDENLENKLDTKVTNITITGSDEIGYSAVVDKVEYTDLLPATKYYFAIYAYIDGKYTRLYDSSSTTSYVTKTYSTKTLDALGILENIKFAVEPKRYKGESSEKEVQWRLKLKDTNNYKLRFELFEPDGTTSTEIDKETGEEIEVPNYRAVNFNGTTATSCDKNSTGTISNGFNNNCYISVGSNNIAAINNTTQTYKFTGNSFIFGGGYYKLVVYAIPYTKGAYDEEHKVTLYQNDSLTTTGRVTAGGLTYDITIPFLEEASFSLNNTLTSGYTDKDGYYVSFVPIITDKSYVMNYGTYTIKLKDEKGNVIQQKTDMDASTINPSPVKFTNLSSNTLYYIELDYQTYRNNIDFTESQKTATTAFTDFTYTPVDAGITLGTITAGQASGKNVTLTYNGSANLSENIVRVDYTISLKGGSSRTTGIYRVTPDTPNIFTIAADKTPKLTIDTSDSAHSSNTSFTFKSGNTYIITTQYYYLLNGKEHILTDQETGNTTYTTILNL